MAIRHEDDCVGCPSDRGCLGSACPHKDVKVYTCDVCGEECDPEDLHDVDGNMVCSDCLIPYLEEEGIIGKVREEDD
ncbi:hypothetical protein [Anaerolactibacter massiliensis]|uniref:hypothetical protein n=1 Tax=Anaerolactibacter massiliensis TaxID=2044573 RepID=UPI000CFA3968|nr:hypothetical protein [Anaerolactibacter massiliensis]